MGPSRPPRWTRPLSLGQAPERGRWNLSLVYLRVTDPPIPLFVHRSLYGIEVAAGTEAIALSAGATFRTTSTVPGNALMWLHFTADRPLQTALRVWAGAADSELPSDFMTEEDRAR